MPGTGAATRGARSVEALRRAGAKRFCARARARSASTSRFRGGAAVTSSRSKRVDASATPSTARANAASFAFDGLAAPLSLRTYCVAAARISSSVAGGSKLWSVLMFLHMRSI